MKNEWKKFANMVQRTHFSNAHGRKFIKLMTTYASGYPVKEYLTVNMEGKGNPFNAVDYDGIPATCPDRVPFEVIKEGVPAYIPF